MTAVVVADAGPLIAMGRAGCIRLLRDLYSSVLVPPAVHHELHVDSERPGAVQLKAALEDGSLSVGQLGAESKSTLSELLVLLGAGEAEAILLAEQVDYRFLLIDERRGRLIARRRGVPVTGIGGVLLAAKKHGLIDRVVPTLAVLEQTGYRLSRALVDELRRLAAG